MIATIAIVGCSPFSGNTYVDLSQGRKKDYWDKVDSNITIKKNEAEQFLGKSGHDLKKYYGEPNNIQFNVSKYNDRLKKSIIYEEEWSFDYSKGIRFVNKNSYSIIYFLNDGIVRDFMVFGVPY